MNPVNQPRRQERGFTLVELMIVVAIIGVLAAIAIPNFLTYQLKSKTAEARTNVNAILDPQAIPRSWNTRPSTTA